jgi:hypothetical protein
MEGLGLGAAPEKLVGNGKSRTWALERNHCDRSAPISPEPLHGRPRTNQRLLSAAPQAPPLTETVFRSFERVPPSEQRLVPVFPLTALRVSERAPSCKKRPALELCLDCDAV